MEGIIKQIYRNAVDNTEIVKEVDQKIDEKLRLIASLYLKSLTDDERENLSDSILDMLFYIKEAMFVLGFKYAVELWTEALMDDREGER